MGRNAWFLVIALSAAAVTGCVERRYVSTSDPPGALVLRNGQPIGATPVDDHFVYYGNYHYTLIKDGFATLQADQNVPSPWYEFFPLDFFSENVVPTHIEDVHRFHYVLQPLQTVNPNVLLQEAEGVRLQGQAIGAPAPAPAPPPPPSFPLPPP